MEFFKAIGWLFTLTHRVIGGVIYVLQFVVPLLGMAVWAVVSRVWWLIIPVSSLLVPGIAWLWWSIAVALAATVWVPKSWWDRLPLAGWVAHHARRRDEAGKESPRKFLSRRERIVFTGLCSAFALLSVLPWMIALPGGMVAMFVALIFWLWARRVRPEYQPAILIQWAMEVVKRQPKLAGRWLEFDELAGCGVLELANTPASVAAKLDEDAEFALHQPRGSVTISADPRLSVRCVRVAFSDLADNTAPRFWDGPSLDRLGRFNVLGMVGGGYSQGCFFRRDGASHIACVGPTGAGKGGFQRIVGLEAALSPQIFTIGIDGKRGSGIGYLQAGLDYLAVTEAQWLETMLGVMAIMEERSARYGAAKRDSFDPRTGDPRIVLMIDDLPEVLKAHPVIAGMLERLTSQGRSLGISVVLAMQKGDAPSYGATKTRSNILDGGWLWAGPATDAQAKIAMLQTFPFDPSTLPTAPGWAALMGRHIGEQLIVKGRTLWIPNRLDVERDVEEFGLTPAQSCPHGTVEDWLERDAVHPALSDHDQQAWESRITAKPTTAAGELIEDFPDLTDDGTPPPADGWKRVVKVLEEARAKPEEFPGGMLRGQIAPRAQLSARHVSQLLREEQERAAADRREPVVAKDEKSRWRLAA